MRHPQVTIFTSTGCIHCEAVLAQLNEWGVQYVEKNISEDEAYAKEMRSYGVYGTPATYIGNKLVLGVQKRRMKELLKEQSSTGIKMYG
ncbi:glutaredoxin [Pontibacillus halophilus JSM 076056 = DSM 19796]|uniref:Glutaredoxin n=1 Tax=Pontibacillus halophilus JSM 076056 = DSM 19796 TaxID=1385510 RepID=A0A0A5GBL4_9BACI|nr:glutaredoxin family protein [Pontibacillus halophilus]KGX90561.1 glutaredoxin [Pontibacillus halophilus JSM 076056 = DSM 19796]